jgi:dolichyl-phosphate-mannose--protein O-mannosyl transferase
MLLLLLVVVLVVSGVDPEYEYVTIGSSIKLSPLGSSQYRLHSHDLNWGSGSGQQSVTAFPGDGDTNSLWSVHADYPNTLVSGTPIRCGQTIVRLKHVRTRNYLHSHLHQAPLSGQQEVSCYPNGNSDTGDNWRVACAGDFWKRGRTVSLQHVDTNMYLSTDLAAKFNQQNCRNCPIQGQLEVRAVPQKNRLVMWKTNEGFYVPVAEEFRSLLSSSSTSDGGEEE